MPAAEPAKGLTALVPSWLLGRVLCFIGALVLLQNLMILHWGSEVLSHRRSCIPIPKSLAPGRPAVIIKSAPRALVTHPTTVLSGPGLPQAKGGVSFTLAPDPAELLALAATPPPAFGVNFPGQTRPPEGGHATGEVDEAYVAKLIHKGIFVGAGGYDSVRADTKNDLQVQRETALSSIPRDELRLFGSNVPSTVNFCVGFSAVSRQRDYVLSLVSEMLGLQDGTLTLAERSQVVVVAHLADFNAGWVKRTSDKLQRDYASLIAQGHFHGMHAPRERYPNLDLCPPACTWGEDITRVKWRSKQNIDYAFLMYYAAPLAPYYLHIEDDIAFVPNWAQKINDHLIAQFPTGYMSKEANTPWRVIDFSELGFVGKLFQSNEIIRVAQFLLLFYDQMGSERLLTQWHKSMTQGKRITYWKTHAPLFRHVGVERSQGGFQESALVPNSDFDNPEGKVHISMTVVPTYDARFLYFPGGEPPNREDACDFTAGQAFFAKTERSSWRCWLWGKQIQAGNHITLVFNTAIMLTAVMVELGNHAFPKDVLTHAALEVADSSADPESQPEFQPMALDPSLANAASAKLEHCGNFVNLMNIERQTIVYWEKGAGNAKELPVAKVRCLRIMVMRSQPEWAIIQRIQVRSLH